VFAIVSALIRVLLFFVIVFLGWYTFQLYVELFGKLVVKTSVQTVEGNCFVLFRTSF